MILAGDIGGTKTNLAVFSASGEEIRSAVYRSRDFSSLLPMVHDFLADEIITSACLGIAGPVLMNRVRTPNLAWEVDGDEVARQAGLPMLVLVNDLVATAEGIPALEPGELTDLNPGAEPASGNAALIAPGTGLGMAIIDRGGGAWRSFPSEGGHQNFAPTNGEQMRLLEFLQREFTHVSIERVVSGPGLGRIYRFLTETGEKHDDEAAARIAAGDPAAEIVAAGLADSCPACVRTLEVFLACFGNAAANLALVSLATGGLFIGGGMAPRLGAALDNGTFLKAFIAKGRLGRVLEKIPVRVIGNPRAAVLGAARCALRLLEAQP